jgi:hypothetical protein
VIDEFPTLTQVENAEPYEIVCWYLYLRPTFTNDELPIVKQISHRYDAMPAPVREELVARAGKEYGR